ncbi:hypothetical protein ES703_78777 [subsurface metagenome]
MREIGGCGDAQNMTTVLKVDLDYKAPEKWLQTWEATRKHMLEVFGYSIIRMVKHETTKGQNYFIEIAEKIPPETMNMLQFLMGDDHTRVKINSWRIERGFQDWNKIFDRKLWRKNQKTVECFYCGNVIPLITVKEE